MPEGVAVTEAPVVWLSEPPGDHTYVTAPPAFNTAEPPWQILGVVVLAVVWLVLTLTVTIAVPMQPLVVPVTVYVVVLAGDARTTVPLVALSPVDGDHVYVVPPDAVKVSVAPAQIVALLACMPIVGPGLTVTVTGDDTLLQPLLLTVTV